MPSVSIYKMTILYFILYLLRKAEIMHASSAVHIVPILRFFFQIYPDKCGQ